MRHSIFGRRLGRDTKARKALLANMASSLLVNRSFVTTLTKAKFVRPYVEKLVTIAKKNNLHSQRKLASLITRQAFAKLTREIAPGFAKREGGYTRIIKLAQRRGDNAELARLEFLPWEKIQAKETEVKKAKQKTKETIKGEEQNEKHQA